MLTDNEQNWLYFKPRKTKWKTCKFCQLWCGRDDCCTGRCPLEQSWPKAEDAAEFEAQVAAKLADIYSEIESEICHVCPAWHPCFGKQNCSATILKYARLQVEGEEDADQA